MYVWDRIESRKDYFSYKINRNNTFIRSVLEQLDDSQKTAVEMLLVHIESNIPLHQMHLDHDANHIDRSLEDDRLNDLFEQAVMTIEWNMYKGMDIKDAIKLVLQCEQFRGNDLLKKKINQKYSL